MELSNVEVLCFYAMLYTVILNIKNRITYVYPDVDKDPDKHYKRENKNACYSIDRLLILIKDRYIYLNVFVLNYAELSFKKWDTRYHWDKSCNSYWINSKKRKIVPDGRGNHTEIWVNRSQFNTPVARILRHYSFIFDQLVELAIECNFDPYIDIIKYSNTFHTGKGWINFFRFFVYSNSMMLPQRKYLYSMLYNHNSISKYSITSIFNEPFRVLFFFKHILFEQKLLNSGCLITYDNMDPISSQYLVENVNYE